MREGLLAKRRAVMSAVGARRITVLAGGQAAAPDELSTRARRAQRKHDPEQQRKHVARSPVISSVRSSKPIDLPAAAAD